MHIAIVGRPNVGKSALFNRIIGKKQALVYDLPGVTRDWLAHPWSEAFPSVVLIDTPGWVARPQNALEDDMVAQTLRLIREADALLWVLDGQTGLVAEEYALAPLVRSKKPLWLVINKCEAQKTAKQVVDFYALGLGEPLPVSAQHGTGIADLIQSIEQWIMEREMRVNQDASRASEISSLFSLPERQNYCSSNLLREENMDAARWGSMDVSQSFRESEDDRLTAWPDASDGLFQSTSQDWRMKPNSVHSLDPFNQSKVQYVSSDASPRLDEALPQEVSVLALEVTSENLTQSTPIAALKSLDQTMPQDTAIPLCDMEETTNLQEQSAYFSQQSIKDPDDALIQDASGASRKLLSTNILQEDSNSREEIADPILEASAIDSVTLSEDPAATLIHFAFIGRPNVGKSSLANRLLGHSRFIVSPLPGTTRDAMSADFVGPWGHTMRLVDTAGIRRWSAIQDPLEIASVQESRRALNFAHVVVLVLDATIAFEKQDLILARRAETEGRALVIALNQWDRIPVAQRKQVLDQARYHCDHFPYLRNARLIPLSALYDQDFKPLLRAITQAYHAWNKRIGTGALNAWLAKLLHRKPHPMVHHKPVRLKYMAQVSIRPPKFIASGNRLEHLDPAYERFLNNQLVQAFGFWGVPLRIQYRSAHNPYQERKD